jgi:signal peptidase II
MVRSTARRERRELRERVLLFAGAAAAVFVADQLTKVLVRATLDPGDPIRIVPGFEIERHRNEGIAFGLFPGRPALVSALTVVALALIALALARAMRRSPLVALGAGMLIGGSLGNLVDRAFRGGVTDYLDPIAWPAFNVADMGIVCGAALIVIGLLWFEEGDEP